MVGNLTDSVHQRDAVNFVCERLRNGLDPADINESLGHGTDVTDLAAFGVQAPLLKRIREEIRGRMEVRPAAFKDVGNTRFWNCDRFCFTSHECANMRSP